MGLRLEKLGNRFKIEGWIVGCMLHADTTQFGEKKKD